jgi:hypothetical protein
MENSANASSGKGYDLKQNTDGTIDICFRQQTLDPAMTTIFILPILFFSSCSGIFGVENTFGMPGGIIVSLFLIAAIFIAGYLALGFFNSKKSSIRIIPGQGIEFGSHTLAKPDIEKISLQAGNIGVNRFRVYALAGGEKIFITEYVSAAMAKAIQSGVQECLNKT